MSIYFAQGGRNKGRVGGSLHSSLISLLVSSPLRLLSPPAAPSCCWHVITEGSRPFLLSYFPAKKAEIVSPPSGTNSSLPSKASIAALYQDDLLHPNRAKKSQSSPFCPNVVDLNSSNYECQASVGGSFVAPSGNGVRCYHGSLAAIFNLPRLRLVKNSTPA